MIFRQADLNSPIYPDLIRLWDGEVGGNAVGAAILVVELADRLGRAVAGELSENLLKGFHSFPSRLLRLYLRPIDQQCCTLASRCHREGKRR